MRVIIMQGVPGSGKSTWTENFLNEELARTANIPVPEHRSRTPVHIVSADHYFIDGETGEYRFNPAKLGEAHAQCMRHFLVLLRGSDITVDRDATVIVDNTNITVDQMSPYYLVARAHGCSVDVVRVTCDPEAAAARNSHGVPREAVLRMARMMQDPPKFWDVNFKQVG